MKRYIPYILAFLALSCIVSCATNDEIANPADGGHMTLRLVSSTMTRAEGNLDNSRNEDKLVTADLYFYSADAQGNAKWHHHIDFTDTYDSATVNDINLSAEVMNQVFGTGTEGQLYVIANYSGGATALPTTANIGESGIPNSSIAELQKYSLTTSFGPASSNATWADQTSFVMDGQGKIEKNGSDVAGTISLTRAAAKIELSISGFVEEAVKDANGNEWTPNFKDDGSIEAYVKLINGVGSSYVGGSELLKPYTYDKTTATDGYYGFNAPTAGTTIYPQKNPFYSYSSDWSANGEANKASLLLVVPWKRKSDEYVDNCYYEIPIGSRDNVTIDRNKYYQISIFVGTLGSFEESENVELTPNITVVDWSTGSIEADINEARYLVVDETEVNIYNKNEYEIGYASSHPVSAVITKITKPDYSAAQENTITIYSDKGATTVTPSNSISGNKNPFTVSIVNGKVVLSHTLNNDNDSNGFDFVPYDITVVVTNEVGMEQTITYKQYPAMYIVGYKNSGHGVSNSKGYVYVNGNTSNNSNWNVVAGSLNTTTSNSPYMYVITVTSFNDNNYIIADPRVQGQTDLSYNSWSSAPALYPTTASRTLTYYYPTQTSAQYENYIAPKFRICSGYGRLDGGTVSSREAAERRCASYQEDGYPAGRWRLPTKAELEYVGQLCADKRIVTLFSNKSYWAASTAFTYNTNGSFTETNSASVVRCVYDDWYWGSERAVPVKQFTWGDMPR